MITSQDLEGAIRTAFPDLHKVVIEDQSSGCGSKYAVIIVSDAFEGKATLAKHRLVNERLKEQITQMHAFSQKSYTVKQYEALSSNRV
ncbi:bola protein [Pterulicium gracile]|uniref:Bola protein n=1 Tax=Pterulicium gracile TaxID=1884261 RepID=A0A5C3QQF0_9AGAR|nr:bola protein [Pterula gracilis]